MRPFSIMYRALLCAQPNGTTVSTARAECPGRDSNPHALAGSRF